MIIYILLAIFIFTVHISTAVSSTIIALMIAAAIFRYFKYKEVPQIDKEIGRIFAVYFTLQVIVAILSLDPKDSIGEVMGEFYRVLLLFFAMVYIKNFKQLKVVLISFLFASLLNDLAGVFQSFVLSGGRAWGLTHWFTMFASVLLIQFPVQVFIASLSVMPIWSRILAGITSMLSILCLILSQTRGAWLAFLATLVIFVLINKDYRTAALKLFSVILIGFMIASIKFPVLTERFVSISNMNTVTIKERFLMWESASNIFKDYPIHGIGQRMFNKMYNTKYILPEAKERPSANNKGHDHPHNNFMKFLCEGGIIGAFSFIFLHGYFCQRLYKLYKQECTTMCFSAGLTGLLIFLGTHFEGLTETNIVLAPIMREYWFLIGMLLVAGKIIITHRQNQGG
ncbi:MAG: O-antigen ligase family protein [Selenomonadaceae bacterium]|nr:O-antigen ligase family protein [Selenomonadaceae bacterium]